jgi:F-type H+-transporting ATPase subunit epsilon
MLKLEIVTPERRVLDVEAEYVSLPTASGEAGILPNHAPLISVLRPGVISYTNRSANEHLAVSSGFAEVNSDTVSVLVDSAETADDIDRNAARAALDTAERALTSAGLTDADSALRSQDTLEHAAARLKVVGER